MSFNVKFAAAVALLSVASGASAAVLNTGTTLGVSGDVVLVAVDDTAGANFEKTFVADLHLTYADLVNGVVTSKTWNLLTDPDYSTAFSAYQGHNLSFFVAGSYALDQTNLTNFDKSGTVVPFSDPINTQWGGVVSGKAGASLIPLYTPINAYADFGSPQIVQLAVSQNINASGENGVSATIPKDPSLGSLFGQYSGLPGSSGIVNFNNDAILFSGAIGGNLFSVATTDPSNTDGVITNLGRLTLDSSTGVLSFGSTTPVPVPAAVWLFASALAGLLGFARRSDKA
ncbi:MAG: VPLPA-CTERM sorting domain-containing protein [Candidatus Methylumidiphilus sp.]